MNKFQFKEKVIAIYPDGDRYLGQVVQVSRSGDVYLVYFWSDDSSDDPSDANPPRMFEEDELAKV